MITNSVSGLALASENEKSENGSVRFGKNVIVETVDLANPAQKFNVVYCQYDKKWESKKILVEYLFKKVR